MRKLLSIMLAVMLVTALLPVLPVAADGAVAAVNTMASLRPASSLISDSCDSTSGFYQNGGLAPSTAVDNGGNSVIQLTRTTDDFRFWKWVDSQSSTLNSANGIVYQFDFYTASNATNGDSSGLLVYSRGHNDGSNDTNLVAIRPRPSDPNTVQIKRGNKNGEVLTTFSADAWHTLAFAITHDANSTTYTYDIYVDGVLAVENETFTLSQTNMHFFGFRTDNWWWSNSNPTGDEYFIDNFYAYAGPAIEYVAPTAAPAGGEVTYYKSLVDFESGTVRNDVSTVTSYWTSDSANTFTIQEVGGSKVAQLYRPTNSTVQMDLPLGSGLDSYTKFVYEFDLSTNNADSEWKFMTDCNYNNQMQWVINRGGAVQVSGNNTGFTMANNTKYRFAWVLDFANGTQDLYVDGAAIATGAAIQGGATNVRALKLFNTIGQWGAQELYMNFDNMSVYAYNLAHITRSTAAATEAPATEAPATEAPATEAPATEAPATATPATEAPTAAPASKIRDINVTDPYKNGNDGTFTSEAPGVLTMTKDKAGTNFNAIFWTDTEDSRTDTTSWVFDAKVTDWEGYVNTWDGYAFSLRYDGGDKELFRVCPNATGVSITRGAGANVITTVEGTGYHAYSAVYNKTNDTLQVYVDGTKVIDEALNFNHTQHGFFVKNGKDTASGCKMRIGAMETWAGEYVKSAPTLVWADPVAPTVSMTAKNAANSANAFYYVITVTLNDGTASAFTVKHFPADREEEAARVQNFNVSNISGVTAKLVSILTEIPIDQADREITTKATLTYTLGGNSASVGAENTTTLNTAK